MQDNKAATAARTALGLLFLVSLFNYMDRFVLSVLLPAIKLDLDLTDTALGAIGTAFTISYVAIGLPLARMADKFSRKKIISASLATWSLMTVACGFAQNFIQLAVARVLVGAGEAGATPPAHSLIADYFPISKRAKAIAVYSLGAPIGLMIGFILASWISEQYSWRHAFLALGLPGILLAGLVYWKLIEPARGQSDDDDVSAEVNELPSYGDTLKVLLSSPAFRHLCFGTGLYTVVYLGVVSWLPSYFVRSFDMPISEVGFWLAMGLGVPQIIGMLLSGNLTDKLVVRNVRWYGNVPALAMFLSTPLFAIVFLTDSAIIATVALFPAFLIGIFQGPASLAGIQGLAHVRMRATAVALFFLIANIVGGTIGPLFTGWLSDQLVQSYGDDSLRYSLVIVSIVFGLWAGLHYSLAARTISTEMASRRSKN